MQQGSSVFGAAVMHMAVLAATVPIAAAAIPIMVAESGTTMVVAAIFMPLQGDSQGCCSGPTLLSSSEEAVFTESLIHIYQRRNFS